MFKVIWDNEIAIGDLPGRYETEREANEAGAYWLVDMQSEDPDNADSYSYEVRETERRRMPNERLVVGPCECGGTKWDLFERSDGRLAIERCDLCSGPDFTDEDAAKLARAAGVECDERYPCIIRSVPESMAHRVSRSYPRT